MSSSRATKKSGKSKTRREEIAEEMEDLFIVSLGKDRAASMPTVERAGVLSLAHFVAGLLADHEDRIVRLLSDLRKLDRRFDSHSHYMGPNNT